MLEATAQRVANTLEQVNFQIPGGRRWHLFEFCDLWFVPSVVKHCCQNMLTAQWTRKMPILQSRAPAELAAEVVLDALENLDDSESEWTVIDFCSGAGGPTPLIEQTVNGRRKEKKRRPIPFRLSDLHPNLDAWMEHASHSSNLSFVPQPVDATNPPFPVISTTTDGDKQAARRRGFQSDGHKVFRLFALSYHHFDDDAAMEVMKSTLETSDAFAIVELQDRNVGSLLIMLLEFWLLFLLTYFWFPDDGTHLALTYLFPVLPFVQAFDGFVSCLRTRTFGEVVRIVERVQGSREGDHSLKGNAVTVTRGEWQLSSIRTLHTWPLGYLNAVVGNKLTTARSAQHAK